MRMGFLSRLDMTKERANDFKEVNRSFPSGKAKRKRNGKIKQNKTGISKRFGTLTEGAPYMQ